MKSRVVAIGLAAVACLAACGDDSSSGATSGGGACSGDACCDAPGCDPGAGGGSTTSSGTAGGGGSASGPCGLGAVANDAFCAASAPDIDCSGVRDDAAYAVCGVAVASPDVAAGVDVSCFEPASYPAPPGVPSTTRLQGVVRIFGPGCESSNVTVQVFAAAADGTVGEPIGTSATTPATCVEVGEASTVEGCNARWECRYLYPNVPTETSLVVKTSGPGWRDTFTYGVFISNESASGGAFDFDAHVVSDEAYGLFAQVTLGTLASPSRGLIAGEVRDCAGAPVEGATIGTDAGGTLAYVVGAAGEPVPDLSRAVTADLGRFLVVDALPGRARVGSAVANGASVVTLGVRDVSVRAASVTWVDLEGMLPTQLP